MLPKANCMLLQPPREGDPRPPQQPVAEPAQPGHPVALTPREGLHLIPGDQVRAEAAARAARRSVAATSSGSARGPQAEVRDAPARRHEGHRSLIPHSRLLHHFIKLPTVVSDFRIGIRQVISGAFRQIPVKHLL